MDSSNKRRKRLLVMVGVLTGLTLVAWLLAGAWASGRVDSARARLDEVIGTIDALKERFPHGDANEAAHGLEKLVAELSVEGVSLIPKYRMDAPPVTTRGMAFRKAGTGWMEDQLAGQPGSMADPPAELIAFLAEHESTLDRITTALLDSETPRWEQATFDEGMNAPIPNLLGHIQLTKLLISRALVDAAAGRDKRASRGLDATWAFANSLDERAFLISRLIGIAEVRYVVVAARHVEVDAATWRPRLDSIPIAEDPGALFIGESVVPTQLAEASPETISAAVGDESPPAWAITLGKPYIQTSVAEGLDAYARIIEAVRGADPCAMALGEGLDLEPIDEMFSSWNIIMKISMPNLLAAPHRLARVTLDAAVTRQVLDARIAAAAGKTGTEDVASRHCADWRWKRVISADGQFTLEWIGPEAWSRNSGMKAPLSVFPKASN